VLIVSLAIGFVPVGIEESIGIEEPEVGNDVGIASVAGAADAAGDVVFVLPHAAIRRVDASVNAPNSLRDRMVKMISCEVLGGVTLKQTRAMRSSQQFATHNSVNPGGRAGRRPR